MHKWTPLSTPIMIRCWTRELSLGERTEMKKACSSKQPHPTVVRVLAHKLHHMLRESRQRRLQISETSSSTRPTSDVSLNTSCRCQTTNIEKSLRGTSSAIGDSSMTYHRKMLWPWRGFIESKGCYWRKTGTRVSHQVGSADKRMVMAISC